MPLGRVIRADRRPRESGAPTPTLLLSRAGAPRLDRSSFRWAAITGKIAGSPANQPTGADQTGQRGWQQLQGVESSLKEPAVELGGLVLWNTGRIERRLALNDTGALALVADPECRDQVVDG